MNWLVSRLYDPFMRHVEEASLQQWRRELLARASGRVLEVGAGTGVNAELYPDDIDEAVFVEPDQHMRTQLRTRLDESSFQSPFRIDERPIEELDAEAGSFDTAVIMLVLCSVDDPLEALRGVYEMLRPGGTLLFLEHVGSQRSGRRRVQNIVEPVWKLCAGNCHLTRETGESIRRAGFDMESMQRDDMEAAFSFLRPTVRGIARRS